MNDDLISRAAAIEVIDAVFPVDQMKSEYAQGIACGAALAKTYVEQLPSAQPETAKRIVGKSRDGMILWYQCDMCNEPVDAQDNFCRGCGRRLTDG
jgi:hypothetical protein